MRKRVAIIQSSYIPWRGYFMIVKSCDVFVILDSVQFTRRDWRSRNRIRTSSGLVWLTIPLQQSGNYHASIQDVEVSHHDWPAQHLRKIRAAYGRAPFAEEVLSALEKLYDTAVGLKRLTDINLLFTRWACVRLGIETQVVKDIDLLPRAELSALEASDRLVALTRAAGGTSYLSGPAASAYLRLGSFAAHELSVDWVDYSTLPPYPQIGDGYEQYVSIIDTFFNLGFAGSQSVLPELDRPPTAEFR